MSHVMTSGAHLGASAAPTDLRSRIGWICQAIRIGAVIWIIWVVILVVMVWSDRSAMLVNYGRFLGVDLSGVSTRQYASAFALGLVDCAVAGGVPFCLWRLSATYLAGRVFTVDAALWLRRTGLAAMAAVGTDVVLRLVISAIFTGRVVLVPAQGLFINPQDLLHVILAMFLLSLASIFKAAAELADDHAQIV